MQVKFWGVRGSIPSPGPDTAYFGGNTSCLQIYSDGQPVIILDAGTGIRKAGLDLVKNHPDKKEIHIFFSHTHWDHIQGLPFFAPLYIPGYTITIHGPMQYERTLAEILDRQMEYTYFPVRVAELQAEISYTELKEQEFQIGGFKASSKYMNHPVLCLGYRFEKGEKSFVYCTDHEPYYNYLGDDETGDEMGLIIEEQTQRLEEFVKGVDLLIMDAQYKPEEYATHLGWGHCSTDHALELALKAQVKRFALFHHDPDRSDEDEKAMIERLQPELKNASHLKEIFGAREGLVVSI